MNVPLVFDKQGIKEEIRWHLNKMQKSLLRKGLLLSDLHGVLLLEIKVSWWQNTQGKGRNKAEQDLSLNKLVPFQENDALWRRLRKRGITSAHYGSTTIGQGWYVGLWAGRPSPLCCTMADRSTTTVLPCS
jgi:hypothetical protein